jgi:hypothetical protein
MNPAPRAYPTRDLVLFLTAAAGILLALLCAVLLAALGMVSWINGDVASADYAVWTVSGLLVLAALLVPGAYWAGRVVFAGNAVPAGHPATAWLAAVALYPVCLTIGGLVFARSPSPGLAGALALAGTAAVPVLAAVWVVRRLGPAITPTRGWGHFTVGLTGMPLAALFVEFLAILPVAIAIGLTLLTPSNQGALNRMMEQALTPGSQATTDLASTLLSSPLAIAAIFGYVALVIPLIEEVIKTMAVWPFLRSGLSGAEAFLGGALGGAGYALFEALFLTQPGEAWVLTTLARSGATVLHMFTAAVTSWGLMQGVRHRRFGRMVGAFAVGLGMHAAWNAAAVTIGLASIPLTPDVTAPWGGLASLAPFLLAGLILVSVSGLTLAWGRLQRTEVPPADLT